MKHIWFLKIDGQLSYYHYNLESLAQEAKRRLENTKSSIKIEVVRFMEETYSLKPDFSFKIKEHKHE